MCGALRNDAGITKGGVRQTIPAREREMRGFESDRYNNYGLWMEADGIFYKCNFNANRGCCCFLKGFGKT